jgi:hypothetical protein
MRAQRSQLGFIVKGAKHYEPVSLCSSDVYRKLLAV